MYLQSSFLGEKRSARGDVLKKGATAFLSQGVGSGSPWSALVRNGSPEMRLKSVQTHRLVEDFGEQRQPLSQPYAQRGRHFLPNWFALSPDARVTEISSLVAYLV